MRLRSTVTVFVACVAFTVALEIPLFTMRTGSTRRRIVSSGTFLSAAKTTTQDISEQEGNFMVNVGIGTPPQNFRLLVQHDRTDTYVLSKDCDTGVCPDHAKFDGSKSTTYTGHPKDKKCCAGTLTNRGTTAAGFAFPAKDNIVLGDVSIRQATFAVVVNNSADRNERESIHFDGVLAKRVGATIVDTYPGRFYPVDCKVKIPDDVKIVMDRKEYVIPGKHLINRLYYPRSCSLNLVATYPPPDDYYEFIIGSPFLREYCQTYDAGNHRIGFSKNTDASEMDTQTICSGATRFKGISAIVVATLLAMLSL